MEHVLPATLTARFLEGDCHNDEAPRLKKSAVHSAHHDFFFTLTATFLEPLAIWGNSSDSKVGKIPECQKKKQATVIFPITEKTSGRLQAKDMDA